MEKVEIENRSPKARDFLLMGSFLLWGVVFIIMAFTMTIPLTATNITLWFSAGAFAGLVSMVLCMAANKKEDLPIFSSWGKDSLYALGCSLTGPIMLMTLFTYSIGLRLGRKWIRKVEEPS